MHRSSPRCGVSSGHWNSKATNVHVANRASKTAIGEALMKGSRKVCAAILVTAISSFQIPVATAQDAAATAVEGHVFNAKNGRPVANALPSFVAYLNSTPITAVSTSTDSNGFYQMDFQLPQQPDAAAVFVDCRNKRGAVLRVESKMYAAPRTEIYRRDFYITFPRGQSGCY